MNINRRIACSHLLPVVLLATVLTGCSGEPIKDLSGRTLPTVGAQARLIEKHGWVATGDDAFWYYGCSDGMIQLELYAPNLAAGMLQGKANDY